MSNQVFLIAEIGQAHDGSLGILHSYIDAVAETGVDAIKFQTHIAEAESSIHEPFRVKFSYQDATRMDYWARMGFSLDQWKEIKAHCEEKNLEFISSPFSNAAVDLLEELGVKQYKVGSGETSNYLILRKIAETGKPIILSSGMSSFAELENALAFLSKYNSDVSVLQCTTSYPTTAENLGLNVIAELKEKFGVKVGFSDHSGNIYSGLAAVSLGAEILEFHAVFDKRMFGPDATSSLEIDQIKQLVEGTRYISNALNAPIDKSSNEKFSELKSIFEKSLAVSRPMKAGEMITFDDLEAKKPKGYGMSSHLFEQVIGKKLIVDKDKYDFLNEDDLQ